MVASRHTTGAESAPDDPGVAIAASIRSLGRAARVFARFASPRVLAAGLATAVVARLATAVAGLAPVSVGDGVALAAVAVLVPFVEWFVHRVVLHARPRPIGGVIVDPGIGHREHHDHPDTVSWVLLRGFDAALFTAVNGAVATAVVGLPLWLIGAPTLGPVLTGVVAATAALAHYEWSHFLFHTAYRPRTARYRRLKANHLRHHWRDERAWLGVTSNLADRLLGTLPRATSR
jgi:hypothetical protein